MKDYDKNKELSYLQHWNLNDLCGLEMAQKLPVNNFESIEDTCQFHEDFMKKIAMEKFIKDVFSKMIFNILNNYINFIIIYHFQQKELKLKKSKSLELIYMIRLNTRKKFNTSIKSRINFEKSSQSD